MIYLGDYASDINQLSFPETGQIEYSTHLSLSGKSGNFVYKKYMDR